MQLNRISTAILLVLFSLANRLQVLYSYRAVLLRTYHVRAHSFSILNNNLIRPSGYIPPELDPELNSNFKRFQRERLNNKNEDIAELQDMLLPTPRVNEIVRYYDKYKKEYKLGKIRFIQFLNATNNKDKFDVDYFIDVVPLREVLVKRSASNATMDWKQNNNVVFVTDQSAKPDYFTISDLQPVKNYFSRPDNGYKVYVDSVKTEVNTVSSKDRSINLIDLSKVQLKADRYRKFTADEYRRYIQSSQTFSSNKKTIDLKRLSEDFESYEDLKRRITQSTLQISVAVSLIIATFYDVELILPYMLGVFGSLLYFQLLSKKVDTIGLQYSVKYLLDVDNPELTNNNQTSKSVIDLITDSKIQYELRQRVLQSLSSARFLVPAIIVGLLVQKEKYFPSSTPLTSNRMDTATQSVYLSEALSKYTASFSRYNFHLLPESEFLASMAGFLTLRLALYFREVAKEFKIADLAGFLPGSISMFTRKYLLQQKEENEERNIKYTVPRRVVYITGPSLAGRNAVVNTLIPLLLARNSETNIVKFAPLLTTSSDYSSKQNQTDISLRYISPSEFANGVICDQIIASAIDRDAKGRRVEIGIPSDLLEPTVYSSKKEYDRLRASRKLKQEIIVCVGPPSALESIYRKKYILSSENQFSNIWISMSSRNQFTENARKMIATSDESNEIEVLVNEAANDIKFFMTKQNAPPRVRNNANQNRMKLNEFNIDEFIEEIKFDHAILNDCSDGQTKNNVIEELLQIFANMRN